MVILKITYKNWENKKKITALDFKICECDF